MQKILSQQKIALREGGELAQYRGQEASHSGQKSAANNMNRIKRIDSEKSRSAQT